MLKIPEDACRSETSGILHDAVISPSSVFAYGLTIIIADGRRRETKCNSFTLDKLNQSERTEGIEKRS